MAALSKETIELVNHLIETCKDGQEGYRSAAADVTDAGLKELLSQYEQQRANFAAELQRTVVALGESDPCNHSSMTGDLHRAWINVRSAFTNREDRAVLLECERGEDYAVKAYREALAFPDLAEELRPVLTRQATAVEQAHEAIRARCGSEA